MSLIEWNLNGDALRDLGRLSALVSEFPPSGDNHAAMYFSEIGEILRDNVVQLELDEDTTHLVSFARSLACEMMSEKIREQCFGGTCWTAKSYMAFPPFFRKVAGENVLGGDVRTVDAQKVAMIGTLAIHLIRDNQYSVGAQALLDYLSLRAPLFGPGSIDEPDFGLRVSAYKIKRTCTLELSSIMYDCGT